MATQGNIGAINPGYGQGGFTNALEQRVLDISYAKGLSHLSSTLTAVTVIDKIYSVKQPGDIFILDNAHCALALYVVLEQWEFKNAEQLYDKHGVHCNRDVADGIWASGGSLGHGIGIAVGAALANPKRNVYVLTSDGAMAEGSNWEALRIASELQLENLRVTVICNGTSAYRRVDTEILDTRMQLFYPSLAVHTNLFSLPEWMQSWEGHYVVLDKQKYEELSKR